MTLDEMLGELLPEIDEFLASRGDKLVSRPHRAAMFVVDHCIESVEGDLKDDYITKPWFGSILAASIDWYKKVYGAALTSCIEQDGHLAVVIVRHVPTALRVPLRLASPVAEDNTFWITLAAKVFPNENPLEWLVSPPKLTELSSEQLAEVRSSVDFTAGSIRRISNGLLMVERVLERARQHAALVLPYLEAAAQSIVRFENGGFSNAIWEANFAAENVLKLHLLKAGVQKIPNIHDVRVLDSLVLEPYRAEELRQSIGDMPTGKEAVQYRYGEIGDVSLHDAMKVYRASLSICRHYANAVPPQRFNLENARLKMKKPPMPAKRP